jgi:hypothetical protein
LFSWYTGMKKQLVIVGIFFLLVSVGLSGCNQDNNPPSGEKNRFVGTWVNKSAIGLVTTINLFSDSTSAYNSLSGTWDVKDATLVVIVGGATPSYYLTYTYVFSDNDSILSLTSTEGGGAQVFINKYNPFHSPSNDEKNKFVGTWENTSIAGLVTTMNFFSNSTSIYGGLPSIWDVKDGKLVIMIGGASPTSIIYFFVFSNNDNTLSLTSTAGGITQVFTKK